MSMWKLFLDDEREPIDNTWTVVRSSSEAIRLCRMNGMPNSIAFDHDLGGDDTALKFVRWMVNELINNRLDLPNDFSYTIHSMNPVGAENIEGYMENILKTFMPR